MVLQNSKIAKFQVWIPNTSWCLHAAAQEKAYGNSKYKPEVCKSAHTVWEYETYCGGTSELYTVA